MVTRTYAYADVLHTFQRNTQCQPSLRSLGSLVAHCPDLRQPLLRYCSWGCRRVGNFGRQRNAQVGGKVFDDPHTTGTHSSTVSQQLDGHCAVRSVNQRTRCVTRGRKLFIKRESKRRQDLSLRRTFMTSAEEIGCKFLL
jgi:hypothetical protein